MMLFTTLIKASTETGKPTFAKFMQGMNSRYREQLSDLLIMASDDGRR